MSDIRSRLAEVILGLEVALRDVGLWSDNPPPDSALRSSQPFCIDTMSFDQWLQFVFVPRVKLIAERQASIPESSSIVSYAEEYFRDMAVDSSRVLSALKCFDNFIASNSSSTCPDR